MSIFNTDNAANRRMWYAIAALMIVAQALILLWMGRVVICTCGYISLFEPGVHSEGNSQHLSDWYTPSHFLHGVIFYGLTHLVLRHKAFGFRLAVAVFVEVAWEVLENTPMVIEHYRNATMAFGYSGDSILNSVMDSLFMILGFVVAAKVPVWASVALFVGLELTTLAIIRDNLTLNVLMLTYPVEAIKTWQSGL